VEDAVSDDDADYGSFLAVSRRDAPETTPNPVRFSLYSIQSKGSSGVDPSDAIMEILTDEEIVLVRDFLAKNKYTYVNDERIRGCRGKMIEYPIHTSVKQNKYAVTKALLKAGADWTRENHRNQTAVHFVKAKSPIAELFAERKQRAEGT